MNGMNAGADDQQMMPRAEMWKNSSEKNVDELNQYATVCIRDDKGILVNWQKFSSALNPLDIF